MQLGLQLGQRQIGLRSNPGSHLPLRLNSGVWLAPGLIRHTLCMTTALALRGNLLRPTHAHNKVVRQPFERTLALVVGQEKFTA
jgi:hypothetical protein